MYATHKHKTSYQLFKDLAKIYSFNWNCLNCGSFLSDWQVSDEYLEMAAR